MSDVLDVIDESDELAPLVNQIASTLPQGWALETLGSLCEKSQYGWTTKADRDGTGVRFLRTTDITPGVVDWATVPFCVEAPADLNKYLIKDGDILISRTGSIGVNYLVVKPEPAVFASYLIRFRPKKTISTKYLKYYLQSPAYWRAINAGKTGIAVQNVNATMLSRIPVPVAPADVQVEIVEEIEKQFSRLDEAVANLQRVKANLKRYKAAILKAAVEGRLVETEAELARREGRSYETGEQLLQRILEARRSQWAGKRKYREPIHPETELLSALPAGWAWASPEQTSASEPYSLAIGPFGSSLKVSDYRTEGVPLVFVRNIRAASFGGDNTIYVTPDKADELSAHAVASGDILVTKMGDPPGDVCRYPANRPPAVITADCIKLRLTTLGVSPAFIEYAIASRVVQDQILGITKGVAQLKVNLANFSSIALPLPPVEEQARIVAEVDRHLSIVREVATEVDANLKRAQALRQATLTKAFDVD